MFLRRNKWGHYTWSIGPRQANLALIAYASSEGSGEPAHPRSLARTSAARSYKQWVKRNLQTESQIPGPSEWLGMRSWNLSWRNARRHKFAWRGPIIYLLIIICRWCLHNVWNSRRIAISLLNKLEMYCSKWNLLVNVDKTKVMIFRKGGLDSSKNIHVHG